MVFGAMFLGALLCHAELARLKPRRSGLTVFYLCLSAGGALGGLLVSQLAPRIFVTYLEWPLALICGFVVAVVALGVSIWKTCARTIRLLLCSAVAGLGVFSVAFLAESTLKVDHRLERTRNFYGAVNVDEDYDTGLESTYRTLTHGGIIHGMQNIADAHREEPVTYYGPTTGIGQSLAALSEKQDAHVAIVGMGAEIQSLVMHGQGKDGVFMKLILRFHAWHGSISLISLMLKSAVQRSRQY